MIREINCLCVCFLHVRGGVSTYVTLQPWVSRFSPRAWRCFFRAFRGFAVVKVFSTCVEVFLGLIGGSCGSSSFLHVRGGVSLLGGSGDSGAAFSPRAWRCFSGRCPGKVSE